jgi:hypothetical protein
LFRHFVAAQGAPAAGGSAFLQLRIAAPADPFATLRASVTGLGADTTGERMQARASQHEVEARGTYLRAILKYPDMIGFGVLAGPFQAVLNRFHADGVATGTIVNARLKVFFYRHGFLSFGSARAS